MFLERIKQNRKTAQFQLTKRFLLIFLGVLILMNLVYLIAAANFVYEFVENKADSVLSTLKNEKKQNTDWEQLIDTFVSEKDDDALIVKTNDGTIYYSEDSKDVFNDLYEGKSLPFAKKIVFSDEGVYYVETKEFDSFTVHLAISGEIATELVSGMLSISLFLNGIALILGSILIYFSVQKWSLTLSQMASEIRNLDTSSTIAIAIPNDPIEINEVATAFNQLLKEQKETMDRERQFITNASHDLKTPIAAIRGHVKLIKRRGESHPEVIPTSIDFIDKESNRLERLSQQLLVLDKTNQDLPKESINLSELVLEEIERNQLLHSREFTTFVEDGILLTGRRSDFQQVCQNLIENAVKYSAINSVIEISLKNKKMIEFKVIDEGIGISSEEKKRVFERFYRADESRTSRIEGSGIGLSIVKRIVDSYQGEIVIQDNHPQGTIFTVKFPK